MKIEISVSEKIREQIQKSSRPKYRGPPRDFGEHGKQGIYFRGIGEQRPNFKGNRGTKTTLGNREHQKTNFRILGNRGTSQFISGEQGNRYPLGRASVQAFMSSYMFLSFNSQND